MAPVGVNESVPARPIYVPGFTSECGPTVSPSTLEGSLAIVAIASSAISDEGMLLMGAQIARLVTECFFCWT